ncbi:hypothetical protein C0992_004323, partial [Termitomyces sp. T32_za158]
HGHSHTHPQIKQQSSRPESITGSIEDSSPQDSGSRSPPPAEFSSLYGHPVATRASLVHQAQEIALARSPTRRHSTSLPPTSIDRESSLDSDSHENMLSGTILTENTPLLGQNLKSGHGHNHSNSHSHSHGSMNMRALVLHVIGDALGNVGVISTGLVIWLTQWSFKYYFDPIISLVITVIIFSSALPLVQSASFILLQGVPSTISLDDVRDSIMEVDGVLSVHELHVWQLSESKVIASVHVLTSRNHDFMPIAVKIREALHHHGIHSSTIQPEYRGLGNDDLQGQGVTRFFSLPLLFVKFNALRKGETSCLVLCPPDQACDPTENACCRQ